MIKITQAEIRDFEQKKENITTYFEISCEQTNEYIEQKKLGRFIDGKDIMFHNDQIVSLCNYMNELNEEIESELISSSYDDFVFDFVFEELLTEQNQHEIIKKIISFLQENEPYIRYTNRIPYHGN